MNQNNGNIVKEKTMFSLAKTIEKNRIFKCTAHTNKISKNLEIFYEQEDFFDIVLVADGGKTRVSAHRIVLSASSDYFLTMFGSSFEEAKATEVTIEDTDGVTLKTLLHFMYTGCIELCCETIEDLFKAADFFQMSTLVEACCEFMLERLDASNCLGIATLAEQHNYPDLNKRAISFALHNYEKVSNENEFLQQSEDQICKLISSDDLYVKSEETVFLSVVAWVEYDKTNRKKSILKSLSLIRFTSLEPKFIEFLIESRHWVCETLECNELICSWLQWHLSPEKHRLINLKNTQPRKNKNRKLAYISGDESNDLRMQTFDPDSNTWSYKKIPKLNVRKSDFRITFINQKLIITGGDICSRDTRTHTQSNSVECFNLLTNEWTYLSPMGSARSYHEAVEVGGSLYVLTGCDTGVSVEKYDFSTNRWQYLEHLPPDFWRASATSLQGHLYVISGITNRMLRYDSISNKWIPKKARTTNSLGGFGCAEVCGKLFTTGVFNDEFHSETEEDEDCINGCCLRRPIQCYNIESDSWKTIKSDYADRDTPQCTELNGRLIVAGGINDAGKFEYLVTAYDPEKNEWTNLAPLLDNDHTCFSALLFTT